jgi:hypothetical protein
MGETPTGAAASPSSSVRSRVEYAADVSSRSLDGCEVQLVVGGSESSRLNPLRPADADRDGTKRSLYTGGLLGLFLPPDIPPHLTRFTPDSRVILARAGPHLCAARSGAAFAPQARLGRLEGGAEFDIIDESDLRGPLLHPSARVETRLVSALETKM